MGFLSGSQFFSAGALALLIAFGAVHQAEAQSYEIRGRSSGGSSVVPGLVIQGVIGVMKAQEEEEKKKSVRRPRTGKSTDETNAKPRCGVSGRPACSDKTANDSKPTPQGGGRIPPIVLIPGTGDGSPPPRAQGTHDERAPTQQAGAPDPSVPRQVLVLVADSQPGATEGQIAQTHGLQPVSSSDVPLLEARAQVYRINDQRSIQTVVTALSSDTRVMLAQANQIYRGQAPGGSAVANPARAAQYALDMIGAESAREIATGRGVKLAVIDSGVDQEHRDLSGAVSAFFDATDGKDSKPDIHGTAIAGIIRARGLVSGVAPDAAVLAARAFYAVPKRDLPESTSFILLRALDWSIARGAQVLNMSFSGARDPVIEKAMTAAARRNVILVAAAGNGGPKAAPAFPAAYPEVIAVTALDSSERLYAHANQGPYVAFAAPGVDILVPVPKNGHMFMSGTSMAAAHISAVIALMLEKAPNLRAEEVVRVLADTATDLGKAGPDEAFGIGRVQARAALDVLVGLSKAAGVPQ